MKPLFKKPIIYYALGITLLVIITGIVLYQVIDNYIVLISALLTQYIILIMILLHVFDMYIKPIQKASKTMDALIKGNFRARMHHPITGSVGELSSKINALARNLSELSIHEKMQAEQFSTVIENTQSGLVLIDDKGYIHLVNRKFLSMFGQNQKDYIGYLYYDVINHEKVHRTVQETFLYEKNVKKSIKQDNDGKQYIEVVGAPIFNERNLLKGAVLVFYDITELKRLEVMRKDFVANVSHELKTPLTSIKGFAETLMDGALDDKETTQDFTQIIYDESNRLQALVEDLLTLSKLEKEEYQLSLTEFNLSKVIKEIIPIIEHQAKEKEINLTVNCEQDVLLEADYDSIKQVCINLLTNAINYTPANGDVSLTVIETDEQICIVVCDTGIGIPSEALPRIFERFYRVDKDRSRNTGGTGLGLAIVKHIVDVHEGKIEIDSEVNRGTEVTVYFPKIYK
ncbi:PAS/PAC sensor signal transduction histidine kinase [Oceanobacillus limi]|uniref:histidine kinase n=1 Tax=Oceanobacillus limi TaxID=930131 RepID=A0A1I0EHU7_9BACI|nr:HAMP domain-containing sensor histidine kinase [Oceanobacillus limi]SET44496.1 PAS/PAC sensor signal transduction histidine kinase [Oceanobacillus limi]